jgi:mannose-6-phosphate isomerase-like protein (cupin superfamily)
MAKTSKATADKVSEFPVAVDRSSELGGYTASFVSILEAHSLAPMLSVLPGGHCSCPHWGYILSGRITITYGDHTETLQAGDAFYMPPGHTPSAEADTEFVMFSPTEELAATEAAVRAGLEARGAGHSS